MVWCSGLRWRTAWVAGVVVLGWLGASAAPGEAQSLEETPTRKKGCQAILERVAPEEGYSALGHSTTLEAGFGSSSEAKGSNGRLSTEVLGHWYWSPYRSIVASWLGVAVAERESIDSGGAHLGLEGEFVAEGLYGTEDTALLSIDERVALGVGWFEIAQRYGQERPVRFGDLFWRPGEGLVRHGVQFSMPAVMLMQCGQWRFEGGAMDADLGSLHFEQEQSSAWETHLQFTVANLTYTGTRVPLRLKVLHIEDVSSVFAPPSTSLARQYPDVHGFYFDIIELNDLHLYAHQSLSFKLGFGALEPAWIAPRQDSLDTTKDSSDNRPVVRFPTAYLGTTWRWDTFMLQARLGTFDRFDPTGYAVDYGGRLSLNAHLSVTSALSVGAEVEAVGASRLVTSTLADVHNVDVGEVGDQLWMGRVDLQTSYALSERIGLFASVWGESSDRSDPIYIGGPVVYQERSAMGTWASLRLTP